MKVTIVPKERLIILNEESLKFDFEAPDNIHAIQWLNDKGHIEFNDGTSNKELNLNDYEKHVKKYVQAWEAENKRLKDCPGSAYEYDWDSKKWVYKIEKDNPGNGYVFKDNQWVKTTYSKKEFLVKCGFSVILKINTAIAKGNTLVRTINDFLTSADYIDLNDPNTKEMIMLLCSEEADKILTNEQAEKILKEEVKINSSK